MQIFDEILEQYMQLAFKNSQYKSNLQSLNFNKSLISAGSDTNVTASAKNLDTLPTASEVYYNYNENLTDIKDLYEKMEFDARRYNRNFDSQTGAFMI